jgi:hypothetical protein
MTQTARPQLHVSTLRSHRGLVLAGLGALVTAITIVVLVIALGSNPNETSIPRTASLPSGVDAGPTAGTPSAVAQTFAPEQVRGGLSLTTNVPALPRADAGPSNGTVAAVSAALHPTTSGFKLPSSLTTNVPAPPRADAGPATGTPTAVRDALSGR